MKDYDDGNLPLLPIKRGEGVYLEDYEGNRYVDAISSWWVNLFGHTHPHIVQAVQAQAATLEHVIFAGFTHEPAVRLAERITALSPKGLNKVFFTDNGSSAVEVAIKMAFHAFANRGEERPLVVSLENSYHGETLGALAAGDVALYKKTYGPLLIKTLQAKSPALHPEAAALEDMRRILKSRSQQICAVIVEPLVQCAGNMAMYDAGYLKALRGLCNEFGVYLIADEIAVGFGRTGTLFAFEQAGVSPDLMTLSKGLTGGFLPLALTLATDAVYDAFYCDYLEGKSFLHSHSYTANPIACAAANATLDLLEDGTILEQNAQKAALLGKGLERLGRLERVTNLRQRGMIAAFDLAGFEPQERIGLRVYREALKKGFLLRPLGNTVYFMPPYAIDAAQIGALIDATEEIVAGL